MAGRTEPGIIDGHMAGQPELASKSCPKHLASVSQCNNFDKLARPSRRRGGAGGQSPLPGLEEKYLSYLPLSS